MIDHRGEKSSAGVAFAGLTPRDEKHGITKRAREGKGGPKFTRRFPNGVGKRFSRESRVYRGLLEENASVMGVGVALLWSFKQHEVPDVVAQSDL